MQTKLSTKGQVVLPQGIRRKMNLRPGNALEARMEGERIVLVPKKERAKVARLVKDPLTGLPMLSAGKAFANSNQGRSSRNSF
jgi:AbrB family looped-hinge helix DNA binding protein